MTPEITPAGIGTIGRVEAGPARRGAEPVDGGNAVRRGTDQVEVSVVARYLSKLKTNPVRQELVDSVRDQIRQGTYDTPEKLDAAMDELLADHI